MLIGTMDWLQNSRSAFIEEGFNEIIIPSIWEQSTFTNKAGNDILSKMYSFKDKTQRDICLIPEVTAIIQEIYNEEWKRLRKKPVKVFYVNRCYRYDQPQYGRYREFTQFGVEILGGNLDSNYEYVKSLAKRLMKSYNTTYNELVKRGLNYYIEDGFEIECPELGAQKQIVGGGKYQEGSGFAIGIDRLMLCNLSED